MLKPISVNSYFVMNVLTVNDFIEEAKVQKASRYKNCCKTRAIKQQFLSTVATRMSNHDSGSAASSGLVGNTIGMQAKLGVQIWRCAESK